MMQDSECSFASASTMSGKRSVRSLPGRLYSLTRSPSLRAMMRKPSCLISCSHWLPAGSVWALVGRHGATKPVERRVSIAGINRRRWPGREGPLGCALCGGAKTNPHAGKRKKKKRRGGKWPLQTAGKAREGHRARLAAQHGLEAFFHQLFAHPVNHGWAGFQSFDDPVVAPPFASFRDIGLQQDPRLQYPARRALSFPKQRFKPFAFLAAQPHNILLYRNLLRSHDCLPRQSLATKANH